MKKCPFCAEEIQDEAIKCRYCGEFITKIEKNTEGVSFWYCPICKIYYGSNKEYEGKCIGCNGILREMVLNEQEHLELTKARDVKYCPKCIRTENDNTLEHCSICKTPIKHIVMYKKIGENVSSTERILSNKVQTIESNKVQTVELTGKEQKKQILISVVIILSAFPAMFISPSLAALLLITGIVWFVIARFNIWWHHG